jgi:hypothetical protein
MEKKMKSCEWIEGCKRKAKTEIWTHSKDEKIHVYYLCMRHMSIFVRSIYTDDEIITVHVKFLRDKH